VVGIRFLVLVSLSDPDPQAEPRAPPRSAHAIIELDNEPELIGDTLRNGDKLKFVTSYS
jgi:hypothetical protein